MLLLLTIKMEDSTCISNSWEREEVCLKYWSKSMDLVREWNIQ